MNTQRSVCIACGAAPAWKLGFCRPCSRNVEIMLIRTSMHCFGCNKPTGEIKMFPLGMEPVSNKLCPACTALVARGDVICYAVRDGGTPDNFERTGDICALRSGPLLTQLLAQFGQTEPTWFVVLSETQWIRQDLPRGDTLPKVVYETKRRRSRPARA